MEAPVKSNRSEENQSKKPPFVVAVDDSKPVLQDPLWRSDPTQAEEAVLRLPPIPFARPAPR